MAVSDRVRDQLIVERISPAQIEVIPAYLPIEVGRLEAELPPEAVAFLGRRRPAVVVYGWRYSKFRGQDLYGFSEAIQLIAAIAADYTTAGLIVLCPDGRDDREGLGAEVHALARELAVDDRVLWLEEPIVPASALWRLCDVMIRPTVTDGDAVSVRECLALGVPVVASDVVDRPHGTVTYRAGDRKALRTATGIALSRGPVPREASPDAYPAMLGVYHRLAGASRRLA